MRTFLLILCLAALPVTVEAATLVGYWNFEELAGDTNKGTVPHGDRAKGEKRSW